MLPPSQKAFVQRTTPVLKFIHQQLEAQRPTLVHCHDGDDRTGIILAAYLVVYQGLSPQAAVRHVRTVNPSAMKMPGYAATVRRFVTLTDRGTQDKGLVIPNVCEESQRSG
jgi:protein-tyrosine phosphatase